MLAERLYSEGPAWGEAWNFGPDDGQAESVGLLATEFAERWGDGARWQATPNNSVHEAILLKLDVSKARSRLGWKPKLNVRDALLLVANWERAQSQGQDARELVENQIADYARSA